MRYVENLRRREEILEFDPKQAGDAIKTVELNRLAPLFDVSDGCSGETQFIRQEFLGDALLATGFCEQLAELTIEELVGGLRFTTVHSIVQEPQTNVNQANTFGCTDPPDLLRDSLLH